MSSGNSHAGAVDLSCAWFWAGFVGFRFRLPSGSLGARRCLCWALVSGPGFRFGFGSSLSIGSVGSVSPCMLGRDASRPAFGPHADI